jgi:hypothetical protein
LAREVDGLVIALDTDHASRGPDALGEQVKAAVRATTDLDDPRPNGHADVIKEPARFVRQLLRQLLQSLVFLTSIL